MSNIFLNFGLPHNTIDAPFRIFRLWYQIWIQRFQKFLNTWSIIKSWSKMFFPDPHVRVTKQKWHDFFQMRIYASPKGLIHNGFIVFANKRKIFLQKFFQLYKYVDAICLIAKLRRNNKVSRI